MARSDARSWKTRPRASPKFSLAAVRFGTASCTRRFTGRWIAIIRRRIGSAVMRSTTTLLSMYAGEPAEFQDLVEEYRYRIDAAHRGAGPAVGVVEASGSDLWNPGQHPQRAGTQTGERSGRSGILRLSKWRGWGSPATTPPTTITGRRLLRRSARWPISLFETRRLFAALPPGDQTFVPFEVTALVMPVKVEGRVAAQGSRTVDHSSGQVFDISVARLPNRERECLQFVLDDLGWSGCLGFIEEPPGGQTLHIGCSPSSRDFFRAGVPKTSKPRCAREAFRRARFRRGRSNLDAGEGGRGAESVLELKEPHALGA